jgi:preprotein translocase subunit SecE
MLQVRVLPGLLLKRMIGMKRIIQFFKDSFAELKKVTWPSREEVLASTKVVIITILLVALVLGIVDLLLYQGLYLLFRTL